MLTKVGIEDVIANQIDGSPYWQRLPRAYPAIKDLEGIV
jgi:hypothetical protein